MSGEPLICVKIAGGGLGDYVRRNDNPERVFPEERLNMNDLRSDHRAAASAFGAGAALLRDPMTNKGTAFTDGERDVLGLRGLLPPRVLTQEQQVARLLENFRSK